VRWGNRSGDEMGDLWVQLLVRDARAQPAVARDIRRKLMLDDITGYETRIGADPDRVALRNDVALLLLQVGQPERAVAHFARVVTLQPSSAAARFNVGTALEAAGRAGDAVAQYREAVRLDADHVKAHERLAVGLLQSGNATAALPHFRHAAVAEPHQAERWNNLAYALLEVGRTEEAIGAARRAVTLSHALPEGHYTLARALAAAVQPAEALRHFEETLRLRPDWIPAMRDIAWLLATAADGGVRDGARALPLALKAVEGEGSARTLDVLAAAYAAVGQYAEAADTAQRALAAAGVQDAALAERIRERLQLYRSGRAFIAPPQSMAKQ
jgi:tetratricopeptide (TPR) repeat protein